MLENNKHSLRTLFLTNHLESDDESDHLCSYVYRMLLHLKIAANTEYQA